MFTYAKYYSIGLCSNCLSWLHSLSSDAVYWIHQDTTVTTHFRSFISIDGVRYLVVLDVALRGAARSVCDPLKNV